MKTLLQEQMKVALKAKDALRLQTIRSILSKIQYEELSSESAELGDTQIVAILKRELKQRNEELEFAEKSERSDLIEQLTEERQVIESFLPTQLSREEIGDFVQQHSGQMESPSIGALMKLLNENFPGRVDGKLASQIIREHIS